MEITLDAFERMYDTDDKCTSPEAVNISFSTYPVIDGFDWEDERVKVVIERCKSAQAKQREEYDKRYRVPSVG